MLNDKINDKIISIIFFHAHRVDGVIVQRFSMTADATKWKVTRD